MNILVFESINQIQTQVVNALIGSGFKTYAVAKKTDIVPNLCKGHFGALVLDYSPDDQETASIITDIKKDEKISKTIIIAHTKTTDKEDLAAVLRMGVSGFSLKPFEPVRFLKVVHTTLERYGEEGADKRTHIRITPKENDKAGVLVRSTQNFKLISGRILNISMGGVLFDVNGKIEETDIAVKQMMKNVQIKFRITTIETDALVVAKKDKVVALKYFNMSDYDKAALSKYMYELIVDTEKFEK